MAGRTGFEFQLTQPGAGAARRLEEDQPLRVLVLGDFSGRAARHVCSPGDIASRPLHNVDVDTFDRVVARVAPSIPVGEGTAQALVSFQSLDDLHPDHLYRALTLFKGLRETRAGLADAATFAATAAGLAAPATPPVPNTSATPTATGSDGESTDQALERLLGAKPASPPSPAASPAGDADGVQAFIRRLVAPHIVADAPPLQAAYLASVAAATTDAMRAVLREPAFQQLEAAWRSVHGLATGLETGERIVLRLLDVSREELLADLAAAGAEPSRSGLWKLVVEKHARAPDGERWSLIVGDLAFGPTVEDADLAGWLAAIGSAAGGPFIAGASPALIGCPALAETPDPNDWVLPSGEGAARWAELRRSPVARWLGLALPRVMLRLPYGKRTDPIQSFEFDELPDGRPHGGYLWGNAAFACARLIGEAFLQAGEAMSPGDVLDVEGLPAHVVERDGEKRMQPAAEVFLSERAGEAILARGPMPLISYRNRDAARLLRFQSMADPVAPLAGPWR